MTDETTASENPDPPRVQMLLEAAQLTNGDRDREYGPPSQNLAQCAILMTGYLRCKYGIDFHLTAEDVAWLNVQQKVARTFAGQRKPDTYIDAAAYAAIAGELAL